MWNKIRYEDQKRKAQNALITGMKRPYDLMQEYKLMVLDDDYEGCKALTDALLPLGHDTAETHPYIERLKNV